MSSRSPEQGGAVNTVAVASPLIGAAEPFRRFRWVVLCACAEAVGMTAAAAATLLADALLPGPRSTVDSILVLLMIVAGGLVEGVSLGVFQSAGMVRWFPVFSRRRWILSTTLVAGLGWAAASAPAQFAGSAGPSAPPAALIIGGGLLLGALMGSLLGAAQGGGLRGAVRHPWRWAGISALAWAPTMAIIFTGATAPEAGWPIVVTLLLAAATGAAAGAVLGLVSGWLWPVLDAPSWSHAFVTGLLKSHLHRLLDRSLAVLQVTGRVSGRMIELPAQYAFDGAALVVLPGRPRTKRWWRNLEEPRRVRVLLGGEWRDGVGAALLPDEPGFQAAVLAYRARWPHIRVPAAGFRVIVRLEGIGEVPALR
jgi:hypothetical protein